MIDKLWFTRSLFSIMLLPLAALYGLWIIVRRQGYRLGLLPCWRAPVPVVIVGNLTVGGNGKTPLVIWLVEQLQRRGVRVGVVARGYGAQTKLAVQLLNDQSRPEMVGDEPLLIYQRTGAPVAVARRRALAVQTLLQYYSLDIVIADDGLQHYALARNFEWVVIDGERRFGNGYWLPAGPLRESIKRLKSVDAIIVNGGRAGPSELAMQLKFTQAVNLVTGACQPIAALQEGVAIAGIGHPRRFFQLLEQQGVRLQRCIPFADHHRYCLEQLQHLTVGKQALLMTEKDAVKCRHFAQPHWWYLPVVGELSLDAQQTLLEPILLEIKNGSAATGGGGLSPLSR